MNPILLLHGALGSSQELALLQSTLASDGASVLTLDFSGHGGLPFSSAGFGIEHFAEEIVAFLNAHKIPEANIFGYSMGGYAALYAGMLWPTRFRRIAVLGTKFDWSPTTAQLEIQKLDPDKILAKVPAFAEHLQRIHSPQRWRRVLSETAKMMLSLGERPLLNDDTLNAIPQEVLILCGDKDTMAPATVAETVAQQIPHATYRVLDNTPHAIEKVDPAKLSSILLQYFR